ncbi:uncharacterized protein LOC111638011 [Centruroides sculpturatus]|uniref:uncharacterized protein LOC111638011 n=1 Tax=Centruroides sculpturatus TaxID=218467 RepID=UPI000C6CAEEE|nr:uncharacterized protein LOC111638011 [Centruroides sculpturatus]
MHAIRISISGVNGIHLQHYRISDMNFIYLISIFFILLCEINCINFYPLCPTRSVDRYCALKDKKPVAECAAQYKLSRGFEILENCFKAIDERGKNMTIDQIIEEVCNLEADEFNAVSNCVQSGLLISYKKDGKVLDFYNSCLLFIERKENKVCSMFYSHIYGDVLRL